MPLRDGKFFDEDGCRGKWAQSPALWNQWIAAARNYAASREVADGMVTTPMKFLCGRWKDWQQPETASGSGPPMSCPDFSWMKTLQEDEKIVEQESKTGPQERARPPWAQTQQTP